MKRGVPRRMVLATLGSVPVVALGRRVPEAAGRTLFVYDPRLPQAAECAAGIRAPDRIAVAGDTVRLARAVFADAPVRVVGLTRHADRLLMVGEAAAHGYREVPAADGLWAVVRRG